MQATQLEWICEDLIGVEPILNTLANLVLVRLAEVAPETHGVLQSLTQPTIAHPLDLVALIISQVEQLRAVQPVSNFGHLSALSEAWLWSLQQSLDTRFTPHHASAWQTLFQICSN